MKATIIIIVVILILGVAYLLVNNKSGNNSPASTSDNTSTQASNSVEIRNFTFTPATITVKAGESITFVNNDGMEHTVTSDGGKFDKPIAAGATITITLNDPGKYPYHCTIHPSMKGTIIVE